MCKHISGQDSGDFVNQVENAVYQFAGSAGKEFLNEGHGFIILKVKLLS
jgi:hypothetical protein